MTFHAWDVIFFKRPHNSPLFYTDALQQEPSDDQCLGSSGSAGGLFPDVNIFPNQALYTSLVIFVVLLVIMPAALFLNLTL